MNSDMVLKQNFRFVLYHMQFVYLFGQNTKQNNLNATLDKNFPGSNNKSVHGVSGDQRSFSQIWRQDLMIAA